MRRLRLLLAALLLVAGSGPSGPASAALPAEERGALALEAALWADPALAAARFTVTARPDRLLVTARVPDAVVERRLREALRGAGALVDVTVDPRLPTEAGSAGADGLDRVRAAVESDPAALAAASLLDGATLDDGVLTLAAGRGWPDEPGLARRLARLIRAQPGVRAVRVAPRPTPSWATPPDPALAGAGAGEGAPPDVTPDATAPALAAEAERSSAAAELALAPEAEPPPAGAEPPSAATERALAPEAAEPAAAVREGLGAEAPQAGAAPAAPAIPAEDPASPPIPPAAQSRRWSTTSMGDEVASLDDVLAEVLAAVVGRAAGEGARLDLRVVDGVAWIEGSVADRVAAGRVRDAAARSDGIRAVKGAVLTLDSGEEVDLSSSPSAGSPP